MKLSTAACGVYLAVRWGDVDDIVLLLWCDPSPPHTLSLQTQTYNMEGSAPTYDILTVLRFHNCLQKVKVAEWIRPPNPNRVILKVLNSFIKIGETESKIKKQYHISFKITNFNIQWTLLCDLTTVMLCHNYTSCCKMFHKYNKI